MDELGMSRYVLFPVLAAIVVLVYGVVVVWFAGQLSLVRDWLSRGARYVRRQRSRLIPRQGHR